jgi:hypothetical protein
VWAAATGRLLNLFNPNRCAAQIAALTSPLGWHLGHDLIAHGGAGGIVGWVHGGKLSHESRPLALSIWVLHQCYTNFWLVWWQIHIKALIYIGYIFCLKLRAKDLPVLL